MRKTAWLAGPLGVTLVAGFSIFHEPAQAGSSPPRTDDATAADEVRDQGWVHARSAFFSPDGKSLLVGNDHFAGSPREGGGGGSVWLVELLEGQVQHVFRGEQRAGRRYRTEIAALSADGAHVVAGVAFHDNDAGSFGGEVRIWDVASERLRAVIPADVAGPHSVSLSADGSLVACPAADGSVRLWHVARREQVARLASPNAAATARVEAVAFSPDGSLLAAAENVTTPAGPFCTLRIWQVATRRELRKLTLASRAIAALAFAPDGQTLALGALERKEITLLDPATGAQIGLLEQGPRGGARFLRFSPDGKSLAACGPLNVVQVWNVAGRQLAAQIDGEAGMAFTAVFSPDGETLATTTHNRGIRLLKVRTLVESDGRADER